MTSIPLVDSFPVPRVRWAALNYTPNEWALKHLHGRPEMFITLATTRQCGKTTAVGIELDAAMHDFSHGTPHVGVLSFDYAHARKPIDMWFDRVRHFDGADRYYRNANDHLIVDRQSGAKMNWYSAEDPYAIAGPTHTTLFIEEAQAVQNTVWAKGLPTILRHMAPIRVTGTPDLLPEQDWFYGLWLRGQAEGEGATHHSHTVTCLDNVFISLDGIRYARAEMSDDEFRMLLLGQWVRASGEVFTDYKECFDRDDFVEPKLNHHYIAGLDIAKERDYTVAYVADATTNEIVQRYRVNRLNYPDLEEQLHGLFRRYRCEVVLADDTGVGNAVVDHLRRLGTPVRGYTLGTNKAKAQLIQNLNRMLQHREVHLPVKDRQLDRELGAYKRLGVSPTGAVTYGSPTNFFDDCVIALALVGWLLRYGTYGGEVNERTGSYLSW